MSTHLRTIRLGKRLSMRALSSLSGVHFSTISRIEAGHNAELDTLIRLAAALGVSLDELISTGVQVCPACGGTGYVRQ